MRNHKVRKRLFNGESFPEEVQKAEEERFMGFDYKSRAAFIAH
jgi:hypothetical protein